MLLEAGAQGKECARREGGGSDSPRARVCPTTAGISSVHDAGRSRGLSLAPVVEKQRARSLRRPSRRRVAWRCSCSRSRRERGRGTQTDARSMGVRGRGSCGIGGGAENAPAAGSGGRGVGERRTDHFDDAELVAARADRIRVLEVAVAELATRPWLLLLSIPERTRTGPRTLAASAEPRPDPSLHRFMMRAQRQVDAHCTPRNTSLSGAF